MLSEKIFTRAIMMFILFAGINMKANLKIAKIFSDNMVLQREMPVSVWGEASPGTIATVKFKGQTVSAKTDDNGKWSVKLKPLAADSKPSKMEVVCEKDKIILKNILVGEVWLCSGQSNMQSSFAGLKILKEAEGINYPLIRLTYGKKWTLCETKNLKRFSAVAYYFGKNLFENLKVPIGLMNISRGCSSIEAWMTPESLEKNDSLVDLSGCKLVDEMKKFQDFNSNYQRLSQEEKEAVFTKHCKSRYTFARKYLKNGRPMKNKYKNILWHMKVIKPAFLFNSLLLPVIPYAIRGAIWYQGETNVEDKQYALKQQILIESWRKLWREGDFPFYIVQIAPYKSYPNLPDFWLEQFEAVKKTAKSGIVSTVDIGDITKVHPTNKRDVGKRLALLALRDAYGQKNVASSGPIYKSAKTVGNSIVVSFDNSESGLTTRDGKAPDWFEVAGADRKFIKADAKITKNTVTVSSPKLKSPKYVRYGWKNTAEPNLCNEKGLPALPFNTAEPFFQNK